MSDPHDHHTVRPDSLSPQRVEGLQDAFFAIVMTLLVLELRIPEVGGDSLADGIFELWPVALSYVVSFVNLGIYWIGHHNQFHYIERTDRVLLWLNMIFLFLVSLVPFTTGLLGRHYDQHLPYVLYGLNLMAIGLVAYWHWCYATHHHRLTDHDIEDALVRGVKRRILVGPILSFAAIGLSFLSMPLSLLMYLVLALYSLWPGKVDSFWSMPAVPHQD